ncbi:cysteine-rich receptor-like protein kinase 40 isoform X2 [Brassica napus]|uniref:cysteine-rich receptor-like protein kinase 40 isoform X2 n=1 Tax=Brassica napus TaxID=3708 RepID=UPI002078EB0C|nr:cysteine-rich receptor-like protein kinase 40 isoform X2 [Brassica napus]
MGKFSALMIILASSLLFVLQTLEVVNGAKCYGSLAGNNSYAQNRKNLFSTLTNKVLANGGFYNASLGQYPNRVYALGLCARGFKPKVCLSCLERLSLETQRDCPNIMDSFVWGGDDEELVSCLVRSSNHSFGNLEISPPNIRMSPYHIRPLINMTLFMLEWEYTVNRTLEAATKAHASSAHKYYSASYAEFTAFPNVYMLMQCTPDITSQGCKQCLEACLKYFREQFLGRIGGIATFPSCYFRWDLYPFHGAFLNVTRVPALPRPPPQEKGSSIPDKKGRSMNRGIITIIVVLTFIHLLVFIGFYKVIARRLKINNGKNVGGAEYTDSDGQFMLRYDLGMILSATAVFSPENKLGQGGFGTVYKGKLLNGKEIAVKRLTRGSEGDIEFKNEVSLLTRLQHKNLVKLLGFCNEGDEEILVYEFVPHSSLDRFIFDEEKRSLLTWDVRFKIIEGIARGLVYLHEDSQLKIIHRDLKASNILLDAEMNPKVADFGTARLFDADETRAETQQIAGTRGYMAPEYLNHGQISAKCDVYSFGVVLLEMITGQRNNSFEEGIAAFVWKRWSEGRPVVIIDPLLVENPNVQIIKYIQTGLLCVQEDASKRPTMSSVMVWLGSETITIPSPKAPDYTKSFSDRL